VRILWSLAWAQLRHHRGRWALLAAGIALVVAVPITAAGLADDVRAKSINRTITQLDPTARALFVSVEGQVDRARSVGTDREIRAQLARLSDNPVRREMLFRMLTVSGQSFFLGATDGLAAAVRLTSGRLPNSCTPTRCEAVLVGSDRPALDHAVRTLGVVVVGTVRRTDPQLVSGQLDTADTPLLLGAGVTSMSRLAKLSLFSRFYAWTTDIEPQRVVALGVPAYLRLGSAIDDTLDRRVGNSNFVRPDDRLQAADDRARVSTRRFQLLGGLAAALLLGFAVVAASGLRRETALLVTALRRRGAGAGQVAAVVAGAAVTTGLVGALVGYAVGAAAVGAVVTGSGRSIGTIIGHALDDAGFAAATLTGVAAAVVTAVLLWPDTRSRALWRLLDLVALFSLGTVVLAAGRGTSNLSDGSDPIVVTLPILTAVVAGLVAARVWAPVSRLAARLLPARSVAGRIGLLGLIRRPLRPAATVAFLTAAVASVVFTGAYRATLFAGDADQAAYQVPLDATLTGTADGPTPADVIDRAGPPTDTQAYPVLRVPAAVTRLAGVVDAVPVLGVDAAALPQVHRWSRVTGSDESPTALAARLRTAPVPSGVQLPAGTRRLAITASGLDQRTTVTAWLGTSSGREISVQLRRSGNQLVTALPAGRLHLVAVGIDISADYLDRQQHATGEGNTDQPTVSGTLTLGALSADGRPVAPGWSSWGSARGTVTARADRLRLAYRLAGNPMIAIPHFSGVAAVLPVAVDPRTAASAHGGQLQVVLDGDARVSAQVVAVLPRMATMGSTFLLADRAALSRVLDRAQPGRSPVEYWLAGPTAGLHSGPWAALAVTTRSAVQAGLDSDPIGRGARTLLVVVSLLALAIAAVALVLLVVGERRDGAGELYAWEADGTRPRTLRRMLVVRLVAVATIAVPVGVAAGLVLANVGTDLVAVDAAGTTPTPPLAVTLGSMWTPLALLAGVGAGVLLGWLVAVRSMRERFPVAAEADLR
jgi:hypothetical protein